MAIPKIQPQGATPRGFTDADLQNIEDLFRKVQWLSAWTIHNANHIRPNLDGLKVGGHQASSASLAAVLCALYFSVLKPEDRVAVKPHASPVFHAIQYLLGNQSLDQLERFRAFGGAQSYPSRTKDKDDVDFSTGSVGLGVAISAFASIAQDYLLARDWLKPEGMGRMISLMGDAELDEGNIYEALIEGVKHDLRNTWWIIDYNRQSLDSVTTDRMFSRFADIFETTGWTVINLKYGKKQQAAFARPGGEHLRAWIDDCPNDVYSALTYKGGAAWRHQLTNDLGGKPGVKALLAGFSDAELHELMCNLGGHDLELLLETFHSITSDKPHCFICYTVKGFGLPFQGHKDNHAGLMNPAQMDAFRDMMGVKPGHEWEFFAGMEDRAATLADFLGQVPFAQKRNRRHEPAVVDVPDLPAFHQAGATQSTQVAFGKILHDLSRTDTDLAAHIVTTSPDVTVSTNLGGWVNQRGIFARDEKPDTFKAFEVVSAQKWGRSATGQHLELGIAENNLFLNLGALGLAGSLFGTRLLPIGTLYDPFIARGLDALNYACYQDARFLLVATPAGLTLAPEGGAHQSLNTPMIAMAQPGLTCFEPAFADELGYAMRWAFRHMQEKDGGSVYLRLSTRQIAQPRRTDDSWIEPMLKGGYWLREPAEGAELAIVYTGALAPEALEAWEQVIEDIPGAGLLAVTSVDLLHEGWQDNIRSRGRDLVRKPSHVEGLLGRLAPHARLVTVADAAIPTLSWLGAVRGHRVFPLGVDRFGQSGSLQDLYATYRLDAAAILDACATAFAGD